VSQAETVSAIAALEIVENRFVYDIPERGTSGTSSNSPDQTAKNGPREATDSYANRSGEGACGGTNSCSGRRCHK